jgi:hypothetical protein
MVGLHLHLLRIENGMLLRSRLYTSVGAKTHAGARSLLTTVAAGPRARRKPRRRERRELIQEPALHGR